MAAPAPQTIGTVASGDAVSALATNAPAGVVSGDLLVLAVVRANPTGTITTPTGWTQIQNAQDGFGALRSAMYWRKADGTGDDTPTVSFSSATDAIARVLRISGQDATTPLDTSAQASQTSGTTAAIPSITTAGAEELLVAVIGLDSPFTDPDPSGWTQQARDGGITNVSAALGIWTKTAATAGSYGGETATLVSTNQAVRIVAAFKPAAGGGGGSKLLLRLQEEGLFIGTGRAF